MDSAGGLTGAAGGKGGAEELADGMARAGTDECWLEVGEDAADGNGGNENQAAIEEPTGKVAGLTAPSSATEAGESKLGIQRKPRRQPLFAGARR